MTVAYVPFSLLEAMPESQAAAVRARAHVRGKHGFHLPLKDLEEIRAGWTPPPDAELADIMHTQHSTPLLGDKLESLFKRTGVAKAMEMYGKWRDKPCDCEWRRDRINELDAKVRGVLAKIMGGE